jgi:hypothetical protein
VELLPPERRYFPTGISWCFSTTLATKTLATADAFGHVPYN